jgi:hypothetical protein
VHCRFPLFALAEQAAVSQQPILGFEFQFLFIRESFVTLGKLNNELFHGVWGGIQVICPGAAFSVVSEQNPDIPGCSSVKHRRYELNAILRAVRVLGV